MAVLFFDPTKTFGELSNYHPSNFDLDGQLWTCGEAYYQARKFIGTTTDGDEYARLISLCDSPHKAKILGGQRASPKAEKWLINKKMPNLGHVNDVVRQYATSVKPRADWDQVKDSVMSRMLYAKFSQSEKHRKVLLATGDRWICENSPYDEYWGSGSTGAGRNRLGVLLVATRETIKSEIL
jgi:hypothetical protein